MKKITPIISVFLVMLAACQHRESGNSSDSLAPDSGGHYIMIKTLSDEDQWLKVSQNDLKSDLTRKLADAYNAAVVKNSIFTDFDLQMHFGGDEGMVADAINSLDLTMIHDKDVSSKLKDYKKEMLYLLSANPDEVDQTIHNPYKAEDDLYRFLAEKYHVTKLGEFDEERYLKEYYNCPSVPEWEELREKRGEQNMVKELKKKMESAKDFDARCIYAIEILHAYESDTCYYENPALPIMEALIMKKKYSLYLNEIWQKWRALYQSKTGASRDSEIPNRLYNEYRNMCACTILFHIEAHPDDINAINEFVVMAYKEDILRIGDFSYGNQAIAEKYYLFPEIYKSYEE